MDSIVRSKWLRPQAEACEVIGDREQTTQEFVASWCDDARDAARDTCEQTRMARERARRTCELSRGARFRATELQATARRLCDEYRRAFQGRELRGTGSADSASWVWPVGRALLVRESPRSGRDPAIEAAKSLLVERYGMSRSEAFSSLQGASSRHNEKLASVAQRLLDDEAACAPPAPGKAGSPGVAVASPSRQ